MGKGGHLTKENVRCGNREVVPCRIDRSLIPTVEIPWQGGRQQRRRRGKPTKRKRKEKSKESKKAVTGDSPSFRLFRRRRTLE